MNKFVELIKSNIITTVSICASVLGFLLEVIGAFAFCGTTQVGVNLLMFGNAMVIIGLILVVLPVIAAIEEIIRAKVTKSDNTGAILALEVALTFFIAAVLFAVIFSAWDLIINA